MKQFKILVRESNYVAYFVEGTDAENAQENWANNGYDSENQKIVTARTTFWDAKR
jgi:hypothetical protein